MGPFNPSEFVAADFDTLETYELQKRVGRVVTALNDVIGSGIEKLDSYDIYNIVDA